jgi:hypothetical protein
MYLIVLTEPLKISRVYAGPLLVLSCWDLPMAAQTMTNDMLSGLTRVCRSIDITWISVHWHMSRAPPAKGGNVSDIYLPQVSRWRHWGLTPSGACGKHDSLLTWFNALSSLLPDKVKLPRQGWSIWWYKAWLAASTGVAVCVGNPKASPETRLSARALPAASGPEVRMRAQMAHKTWIKTSLHQTRQLKEKIKKLFTTSVTNISSFNAA